MSKTGAGGKRRLAREYAVMFLYQSDLNPSEKWQESLNDFWSRQETEPSQAVRDFTTSLIKGVLEYRLEADKVIVKYAENWALERIAAVDRAVLRLAIYEMLHRDDIPPVVSINEAIEIAKKFSTDESGKFVNGILDRFRTDLLRPARTPSYGE